MSGRAIHTLAVMMAVVSFVSCGRVRTGRELGRIESRLRSGSADSAALMLSQMERNRMPKSQAARFTVLNAMATDKLNIDDGSLLPSLDSLSEWYVTHGRKRDRMLFWYYYGDQFMDSDQQDNAMIPFLRCLDIARNIRDWFYAGMASREVSVIYKSYFDSKSELEYISQSEEYFRKADARIHYINALYLKAQSLYNRGMIEESSSAYKQVISIAEESSDTVMLGKALMYFAENFLVGSSANPEEAYKLFTKAAELNAEFHVEVLARYAYAARMTGHSTESLELISEARSMAETPYEKNLVDFYSSKMDLAVGPEEYQSILDYLDSVAQKATLNSPLRAQMNFISHKERTYDSNLRDLFLICSVVAILLMTSVIAFWIYRKHSRKREATLRETVKVLNADLNHFKDRAEQLLAPEIRTMDLTSRFLNLLSRHFDKDAVMSVFKDEQFRRTFIEIVDILHDGHVTLLERKLNLKPDNVILFAMYISSFSVNTITCSLSIKSDLYYNSVPRARSRHRK